MSALWLEKVKVWSIGVLTVAVLGSGVAGWALVPAKAQGDKVAQDIPVVARNAGQAPAVPMGQPDAEKVEDLVLRDTQRLFGDSLKPSPLAEPAATDSELQSLRKARHTVALEESVFRIQRYIAGARGETIDVLLDCISRIVASELALSQRREDHITAYERVAAIAKTLEFVTQKKLEAGLVAQPDLLRVRYTAHDMRIKLLELKAEAGGGK